MAKETISQTEGLCKEVVNCIRNAYDRGYKQGQNDMNAIRDKDNNYWFELGLKEVWEFWKKFLSLEWNERRAAMGIEVYALSTLLDKLSASEAISRMKTWEEKQKADSNKVTRQSIIKSQLMDIVNGQENPVTADEIAEVLEQLKGEN